jgi:parallel beta-helix repeat protein
LNNQILDNKQCGIHFGGNAQTDCIIKNNTFSNNLIKNNTKGGILICYAKENNIIENNIEINGEFGIKILYLDGKNAICENNKIYHNNIIKNGEYGLFNKPDNKKYSNGIDSNNGILSSAKIYNQWDNGTIDDNINVNLSSEKGGNYWNDYEDLYNNDFANNQCGYYGIWKWEYHMKIQFKLYLFKGFINKVINLNFLESKASDQYPWCRKNGWKPSRPDKPILKVTTDFLNPKKYFISCCCNDSNGDKITYEINIINSTTNETITGWQILNAKPVNASENFDCIYIFNKNGFYNICIRAYDVREGNDNSGKGFDGKSEIATIPVKIY